MNHVDTVLKRRVHHHAVEFAYFAVEAEEIGTVNLDIHDKPGS